MTDNRRDHHRVNIIGETDVYVTISGGLIKHKVLDLSDGGVCFLCPRKLVAGENERVSLHFPWLSSSIDVTIKIVRAIAVAAEDEEEDASKEGKASEEEPEEDLEEVSEIEKEKKKAWAIASRFVALTMGQEDKLFREVRRLERELIAAAKNKV